MSEKRNFLQTIAYGLEKFGEGICNIGAVLKKNWRWSYELRKVIMAIPVVAMMLSLANECRQRLPKYVGINLLSNGQFERMVGRDKAIIAFMGVTCVCLVFMFVSRKTIYPWLISLLSLLLPVILIITNIFPA